MPIRRIVKLELMLMGWERRKLKKALMSVYAKSVRQYSRSRWTQNEILNDGLYGEVKILEDYLLKLEEIRLETDDYIYALEKGETKNIKYDADMILKKFESVKREIEPLFIMPYLQKNENRVINAMSRLSYIIESCLEIERENKMLFTGKNLLNDAMKLKETALILLNKKKTFYAKRKLLRSIDRYEKRFYANFNKEIELYKENN